MNQISHDLCIHLQICRRISSQLPVEFILYAIDSRTYSTIPMFTFRGKSNKQMASALAIGMVYKVRSKEMVLCQGD